MIEINPIPKPCTVCKGVVIPDRRKYYEGENVICNGCGTVYTVVKVRGLMDLQKGDGMVSRGIRLLRYLDQLIEYKIHLTAYDLIYFRQEDIALRYAELLRRTGTTVSWYGESLIRGRSPERDIIRDGLELYAVSR